MSLFDDIMDEEKLRLNDPLPFGKYKGEKLHDIIEIDLKYIEFMIDKGAITVDDEIDDAMERSKQMPEEDIVMTNWLEDLQAFGGIND